MAINSVAERIGALLDSVIIPDGTIGLSDRAFLLGQYFIPGGGPSDAIVFNLNIDQSRENTMYIYQTVGRNLYIEQSRSVTVER